MHGVDWRDYGDYLETLQERALNKTHYLHVLLLRSRLNSTTLSATQPDLHGHLEDSLSCAQIALEAEMRDDIGMLLDYLERARTYGRLVEEHVRALS